MRTVVVAIYKKKATNFKIGRYVIYQDEVRTIIDKHFGNDNLLWLQNAKGEPTKKSDLYQFYFNDKPVPNIYTLYLFFKFQFCEVIDSFFEDETNPKRFSELELTNGADISTHTFKKMVRS